VFPELAKKEKIPQEAVLEQENSQEELPENSEKSLDDLLEGWAELQRVLDGASMDELFEKGWKPILKNKPNGKQYMVFRLHGRDENGHQIDTERGLGSYNPDRWDTILALYEASKPELPRIVSRSSNQFATSNSTLSGNRSSILTTKVGRVTPIGPSVQIKLETLQWYTWVQNSAGYPGTLDDFINQSVDTLFREHFKIELAVVNLKEENS